MKLITLLGQTSSGKTRRSLDWAHELLSQGENAVIVNCDSRQIYKDLDIGTGKISGTWQPFKNNYQAFYYEEIPHFLIDFIEPEMRFSMADYLQNWCELFTHELLAFEGTVILVGGTGLWAEAVYEEYQPGIIVPEFSQQYENLKQNLNNTSFPELQKQIVKFNLESSLNESDSQNPRRLINRVLKYTATTSNWTHNLKYPFFDERRIFALEAENEQLKNAIGLRLQERIDEGLLNEVESLLHLNERLLELGLEYRLSYLYLLGQLTHDQWQAKLLQENISYAKRQLTWLKKQNVIWIKPATKIQNI